MGAYQTVLTNNHAHFVLETEAITVVVVPDEGGRISSLRSKVSGLEFLTQSSQLKRDTKPGLERLFHEGACAGAEECLPSVAPCGPDADGGAVPDHGDFWQLAWQVTEPPTATQLCIEATGFSRPLRFRKKLLVRGNTLQTCYCVENIGMHPVSFLYAHHPLFAVTAGDRILLPTQQLVLNYSRNQRLGLPGAMLDWPGCNPSQRLDLSVVQTASACTAEMLYTQRLEDGSCGLWRASQQQGVQLSWNASELPFLGVWLCYGGWPDITGFEQQYAVALEPTLAPCGTLAEAQQKGFAKLLAPSDSFEWCMDCELSGPGISFEEYKTTLDSYRFKFRLRDKH